MRLPKYHETFIQILKVLESETEIHHRKLRIKVREKYYKNLSDDLLNQETKTGANVLLDRIGWGISYLKMGKFVIYPKRGFVKITEKGKLTIKKGKLSLQDLKSDSDFIEYRELRDKKIENKNVEEIQVENDTPQELIETGFSIIENQTKSDLLEKLIEIDPYYFEKVILILLKKMGYGDFIETSKSNDGGIDGIINEDRLGLEKIYTQAKRYNKTKVRETEIRNFIGAMSGDTQKGVFITTSAFDEAAIKKAHDAHHTIILIDGSRLVDLMYQFNVGIQIKTTYEVKELDNDFFEGD